MGLKNRIELLDSWNLLAVEYTAARLINHTVSETTKVLDLLARLRDRQIVRQGVLALSGAMVAVNRAARITPTPSKFS